MTFLQAGICLTAVLTCAPAWPGEAQPAVSSAQETVSAQAVQQTPAPPTQVPPAPTQAPPPPTQTPPATGTPSPPPPDQEPAGRERQRPSSRTPRPSRRQPNTAARGSFEERLASRDAGPVQQRLMVTANVLGGYDDNVTGGLGGGSVASPTAMASGTTAYLDGMLDYFRGNARHSIWVDATGSLTAYPDYLDNPAPGALANVAAMTTAGRNTRFNVSERVGYEPLFNVYSQGSSSVPLPPDISNAAPAMGLFERRSLSSTSLVSLDQRLGRRDWTSLSYTYRSQQFTEDDFGDNRSHEAEADFRRGFSPEARLLVRYRYRHLEYTDAEGDSLHAREHRVEGGPEFERVLSRRRQLTFSLAAGATRMESVNSTTGQPYDAWKPTGNASLNFALSPAWNVEGGYRRDLNTFQGVTDEVYTTDTAFVGAGGSITGRTDVRLGADYGHWRTQVAAGAEDTMDVYGAWVRLTVSITRTLGATAAYYYYYHRYSDPAALPEGFPAEYDRQAVRVGFTIQLPLAGSSTPPQLTPR